jgi:hypothetical protein
MIAWTPLRLLSGFSRFFADDIAVVAVAVLLCYFYCACSSSTTDIELIDEGCTLIFQH